MWTLWPAAGIECQQAIGCNLRALGLLSGLHEMNVEVKRVWVIRISRDDGLDELDDLVRAVLRQLVRTRLGICVVACTLSRLPSRELPFRVVFLEGDIERLLQNLPCVLLSILDSEHLKVRPAAERIAHQQRSSG